MAAPDDCTIAQAAILSRLRGDPPWRSRVSVKKHDVIDVHAKANMAARKYKALLKARVCVGAICKARSKMAAEAEVIEFHKNYEAVEIEFQKLYEKFDNEHFEQEPASSSSSSSSQLGAACTKPWRNWKAEAKAKSRKSLAFDCRHAFAAIFSRY